MEPTTVQTAAHAIAGSIRVQIYAHMQAVAMVNDHVVDCYRYRDVRRLGTP